MSRFRTDDLLVWSLRASALITGAIAVFIVVFVGRESVSALGQIGVLRFLTDASWHPGEKLYNLVPMLSGSLLVTLGAVVIAAPLGIASAIFCNSYAPEGVARLYRRLIELLAGIPSVVFGFWGLVTLVPLIAQLQPPGTSLLAGIAILALMILPTIALIADQSLARVPKEYWQGAAALGLTRWASVRRVALSAARPGIIAGVFLAAARAIGETMAVLMVCGNVVRAPSSIFSPIRTLTANIALEMAYAMGAHRSALFVTGLALFAVIILLVLAAETTGKGLVHA